MPTPPDVLADKSRTCSGLVDGSLSGSQHSSIMTFGTQDLSLGSNPIPYADWAMRAQTKATPANAAALWTVARLMIFQHHDFEKHGYRLGAYPLDHMLTLLRAQTKATHVNAAATWTVACLARIAALPRTPNSGTMRTCTGAWISRCRQGPGLSCESRAGRVVMSLMQLHLTTCSRG